MVMLGPEDGPLLEIQKQLRKVGIKIRITGTMESGFQQRFHMAFDDKDTVYHLTLTHITTDKDIELRQGME